VKKRLKKYISLLSRIFPLIDPALIVLGFLIAFRLRYGNEIPLKNWEPFVEVLPWMLVCSVILFAFLGMYRRRVYKLSQLIGLSAMGVIGIALLTIAITFWLREFAFPRSVILIAIPIQIILICILRYVVWSLELLWVGKKNVLVIGSVNEASQLVNHLNQKISGGGWFVFKDIIEPSSLTKLPGNLIDFDAVLISSSLSREEKAAVLEVCLDAGIEVFVVPDMYDILLSRGQLISLNALPVIQVQNMGLSTLQAFAKRSFDLVITIISLLILMPVLILFALMIKISSRGPVFYKQKRVGLLGKNFHLYKFRTMVDNAEVNTGPVLSVDQDPRVTKVGRILRASRLDELPQLINVLKGDMSLVGPRPERPFFAHQFADIIPNYYRRHIVRPGLTGLAQIYGKYSTTPEDKLRYDLYYIKNYSLFLDLKIILSTIPIMLDGKSANGTSREDCKWLINT